MTIYFLVTLTLTSRIKKSIKKGVRVRVRERERYYNLETRHHHHKYFCNTLIIDLSFSLYNICLCLFFKSLILQYLLRSNIYIYIFFFVNKLLIKVVVVLVYNIQN